MARYLISFGAHAMDHVPESDLPEVGSAARAVVQEIVAAGALVVAGGMADVPAAVVAADGTVSDGPHPDAVGALTIVEVPSREEALRWAARLAGATRCAQEVREIGPAPEVDEMVRRARG